ncbi:MAG: HAMP domain-containing histidine kinase [Roseburia sp.]|nr:HAMP domain-containing histidine kinase [Roseburia sp.]
MRQEKHKIARDYQQLKYKIFFNSICLLMLALIILMLLYNFVFSGRFANWTVYFLEHFVFHDYTDAYDTALLFYRNNIRTRLEWLFLFAFCVVFALVLRIYLNNFTRYFNEINQGIDALIQEGTKEILLSSELAATEKKLNFIRHTLMQRKAEANLSEQRKNDLIVYLAHDLKTPLTSIIGYLTLLSENPDLPVEARAKYMNIALDKAQRLEDLINEFFDITRFNLTSITLEAECTNLSRMLEQTVSEFYPILTEKNLTWNADIPPGIWILCDRNKLARVFDNLIRNAVNYSYEDSEVSLSLSTCSDNVEIVLKNRGKTIPPQKLIHIFEQFYRVDTSRSSSTGGSGLGLAIAKEIIELHGGMIQASSKDESIVFLVRLPLVDIEEVSQKG